MKKILLSLGLILALVFSLAMPTVAAADECKHTKKEFVSYVSEEPSDCSETGIAKFYCPDCKATFFEAKVGEHDYDWKIVEATCFANQKLEAYCSKCSEEGDEPLITSEQPGTQLSHNWKKNEIEASCESVKGTEIRCTKCETLSNDSKITAEDKAAYLGEKPEATKTEELEEWLAKEALWNAGFTAYVPGEGEDANVVLPHEYDGDDEGDEDDIHTVATTCQEAGYTYKKCVNCGKEEKVEDLDEDKTAHVNKDVAVLKEATCKNDGIKKVECKLCKAVNYETIPSDHNWVNVPDAGKEPTCGKAGTGKQICGTCEIENKEFSGVIPATGNHNYEIGLIPATCTTDEIVGMICTVCKAPKKGEYTVGTKAFGHNYGNPVIVEATCEQPNGSKEVCSNCNDVKFTPFTSAMGNAYQPAFGHEWELVAEVEANCTEKGVKIEICKTCAKQKTTETDPVPGQHVEVATAVLKAPTCSAQGIGKFACSACKLDLGYKVIDPTHSYGETIPYQDSEATCGDNGLGYKQCSICEVKLENQVIPATGKHEYEELPVVPDCEKGDGTAYVCVVCGDHTEPEYDDNYEGKDHNWSTETLFAATCEKGNGTIKTCLDCGKEERVYFDAEAHKGFYQGPLNHKVDGESTYKTIIEVKANCITEYYKKEVCTLCNNVKETKGSKDSTKHNKELVTTLEPATCTEDGVGKFKCSDCDKDLSYQIINKAHKYGEVVANEGKEPTCKDAGVGTATCTVCGYVNNKMTIDKLTTHTETEVSKAATCTVAAYTVKQCSVCKKELSDRVYSGEALGHDLIEKVVEATCTNARGIQIQCSRCTYKPENGFDPFEDPTLAVAAFEHKQVKSADKDYSDYLPHYEGEGDNKVVSTTYVSTFKKTKTIKAPTCSADGYTEYKCELCGKVEKGDIKKSVETNHVPDVQTVLKEGTCKTPGIGRYVCKETDCKKDLGIMAIVIDHTFTYDYTIKDGKAPTCSVDGYGRKVCSVCGYKEDAAVIEATGEHTYVEGIREATCTEAAYYGVYCTGCGQFDPEFEDEKQLVTGSTPAHKWGEEVYKEADCEKNARMVLTCTVCNEEREVDVLDQNNKPVVEAYGHNYDKNNDGKEDDSDYTTLPANCERGEYKALLCTRCGEAKEGTETEGNTKNDNNHVTKVTSVLRDATCTVPGVAKVVCTNAECAHKATNNAAWTGYQVIEPGHKFNEESELVFAEVVVYNTCANCEAVKVVKVVLKAGETDTDKLAIQAGLTEGESFDSLEDLEARIKLLTSPTPAA